MSQQESLLAENASSNTTWQHRPDHAALLLRTKARAPEFTPWTAWTKGNKCLIVYELS